MRIITIAFLALATALTAAPVVAADLATQVRAHFSERQRELITNYARSNGTLLVEEKREPPKADDGKGKGHGQGHSKHKGLPPGIAMNLERGKSLPPGIAKKQLPATLVKQLPPAPKGHEIVVVDGRVLLVDKATQLIRDRIENVVFR